MKNNVMVGIAVVLIAAFALAACGTPAAPAAPTADANAVYTQAAATVAAGLTQTAEKNPAPTATPAPATSTPTMMVPTATQASGGTQAVTATSTQASGTAMPTATNAANGSTPVPTATKASAPPPSTGDKAEWVSQSPVDNTKVPKNATFNVTFVLKNIGTTTWTKDFMFRFFGGEQLGGPKDLNLTKEVKPGETVEILFTLVAPDTKKNTETVWVLTNANGQNFYNVYLKLEITD
jgi:hypothetical protein